MKRDIKNIMSGFIAITKRRNNMEVICISGQMQSGKDTVAMLMKTELEAKGKKVLITHYADLLKYICSSFLEWNGVKDVEGRSLLQYVGTDIIRKQNPSYWVDFITSILDFFPDKWDVVIIPDARFPNEVNLLKQKYNTTHCHIVRDNYEIIYTDHQHQHSSETSMEGVTPDCCVYNQGTLEDLKNSVISLLETLSEISFKFN